MFPKLKYLEQNIESPEIKETFHILMFPMCINHLESILSVTLDISKEILHFLCEGIIRLQHHIGAVVVLILTVNHFNRDGMQNVSSQSFREMYRHCQHILRYSRK